MDETAGIYARESGYLDRHVQVGVAQGRVLSVAFRETPDEDAIEEHEILDRIGAYLEGDRDGFEDVEVALTLPTDRRRVLETVRQVPYGQNATVEQVDNMTAGLEGDEQERHRTVREALDANPTPILVPTHRVRDGPGGMPPDVESKLRALEGL